MRDRDHGEHGLHHSDCVVPVVVEKVVIVHLDGHDPPAQCLYNIATITTNAISQYSTVRYATNAVNNVLLIRADRVHLPLGSDRTRFVKCD